MVRFSTVTFWLSFISETDSVGTTICRTAFCCPSDTTRCSRFCLTLFSWPEYVLTTYQRNIRSTREGALLFQYEVDKFLGHQIGYPRKTPATITNPSTTPVAWAT